MPSNTTENTAFLSTFFQPKLILTRELLNNPLQVPIIWEFYLNKDNKNRLEIIIE